MRIIFIHKKMLGGLSHFPGKFSFPMLSIPKLGTSSTCYRPVLFAVAQDQDYWASIQLDIKDNLEKVIQIRHPVSVFKPMHQLTFAPPRTAAPALCIAACELVGGDRDQAIAAASAIHLMHAAMYAHEHLPLASGGRPKPTIQHKLNPNVELMTGDGIIPFALELLAKSMEPAQRNSDNILRVIIEITRAMGSQGIVDGQFRELFVNQPNKEESNDIGAIEYACKKKEGELHACGAACGAIMGGGSEEEIEKMRKYGLYFGMVQGMLHGVGRNNKGLKAKVEKLRALAIKELESFNSRKVETFHSLLELEFEPKPQKI